MKKQRHLECIAYVVSLHCKNMHPTITGVQGKEMDDKLIPPPPP